ncbi:NC domain protein [compost metagenome]
MLTLRPGDHLVSPRVGYQHHGIYIGQQHVIHYQGLFGGNETNLVAQSSLREFSQGNAIRVQAHPCRRFSGKKSVERAHARLGERQYNLLLNNCEHFVMWCIEGESASAQVRQAVVSTTTVSATAQVAQATLGNAATTTAGLVASSLTATASGSVTTATVASLVGVTSAPILTPLVVGVVAAYGAAKLWDWLTD